MAKLPDAPPPIALTVAETAKLMRVSRNTVYRLAQSGELPTVHIGRLVFVRRAAIDAFYDAQEAANARPVPRAS
jgi:excisionase family DNA binding protein